MILVAFIRTKIRSKYVDFTYPLTSDPLTIVIKNDLDQMYDYTLFFDILNYEVWIVLFCLSFLPQIIIGIQDEIKGTQKFVFRKFVLRLFESKMFY